MSRVSKPWSWQGKRHLGCSRCAPWTPDAVPLSPANPPMAPPPNSHTPYSLHKLLGFYILSHHENTLSLSLSLSQTQCPFPPPTLPWLPPPTHTHPIVYTNY